MADTSAGLLGFDPEVLKQMMSQFGANDADKNDANKQALFALGFGLLGGRRGQELATVGRAGLGAMQYRQGYLDDLIKQRGAALSQGAGLMKLSKDIQATDAGLAMLNGGGQQPTGAPPAPPIDGGTPAAPPMAMSPGGTAPPPLPQAAPLPAAPPAQPGGIPPWANPRAETAFAVMGKKDIADVIHRQYQITQGPSGTLMRNGQIVGQVIPNAGMIVDGKFQPLPPEATAALVGYEGAKAGAVKAAEFPYQLDTAQNAKGEPQRGYAANLYGPPPIPQQQPPSSIAPSGAGPGSISVNVQNAPPGQVANMLTDIKAGGNSGLFKEPGQLPQRGVVTGPNPVVQAGRSAEAEGMGKGYAEQAIQIDTDAKAASLLKARVGDMQAMMDQFSPNMAVPARKKLAEAATAMGASKEVADGIAGGSLSAMQVFQKQSVQQAFEAARQQMGGVPRAYQEIAMQVQSNPNLEINKDASKHVMAVWQGIAEYQLDKQKAKDQWLSDPSHERSLAGFEGAFNRNHPPANYLPPAKEFSAALNTAGFDYTKVQKGQTYTAPDGSTRVKQ